MKKFCIYFFKYNLNSEALLEIEKNILHIKNIFFNNGYVYDEMNPDFVISFGGDGTLLKSEEIFPGLPKLFLKNTNVGKLAQNKKNEEVINLFIEKKYFINSFKKVSANIFSKDKEVKETISFTGNSEVTIRNYDPRSAIRFHFSVDKNIMHHELIGDGVIICNSLGSTGYYKSITDSYFEVGMGVAFNNTTEVADHIVLNENRKVTVEITRGPAIAFADNQDAMYDLFVGDKVEICLSDKTFNLIRVRDEVLEG